MKRRVLVAVAVLAIIALSIVIVGLKLQIPQTNDDGTIAPTSSPTDNQQGRIVVPTDYATIKEAAVNAVDGDTIYVKSGTYQESNITINHDISIVGENRETTLITSQLSTAILFVNQSQVTITGFTIKSGDTPKPSPETIYVSFPLDYTLTAIKIQLSQGCNISDNKIINSGRAIWVDSSSNNIVEANILRDNYYGVDISSGCYPNGQKPWIDPMDVEPSSNNIIRANDISNSNFGVYLHARGNNTIVCANSITAANRALAFEGGLNFVVGNYIADNVYAAWFYGSSGNVFHHNNFVNNSHDLTAVEANLKVPYSVSIWDDGKEGNYWSDFSKDGNFSAVYNLNSFNRDNCPLFSMVDIKDYASYSSTVAPYPIQTYPPAPKFP
jgi:parallel beta-helix repeat protein